MAKKRGVTYEQFEAMALALPAVVAGPSFGTPGMKVGKKFMARLREPDVLVLKPIFEDEQRFLMETEPETFFLTDHYRGFECILIRLSKVEAAMLEDMVVRCWRELALKKVLAAYDGEHEAAAVRKPTSRRT